MIYTIIGRQCLFPAVSAAEVDENGSLKEVAIEWSKTPTYFYDDEGKAQEKIKELRELSGKDFYIVKLISYYELDCFKKMAPLFYKAFAAQCTAREKFTRDNIEFTIDEENGETIFPYLFSMRHYPFKRFTRTAKNGIATLRFEFESGEELFKALEDLKRHGRIRSEEEKHGNKS